MSRKTSTRKYPALKHAAYATTALLPGESRAEFEKLHRELIKELQPDGPLEDDPVLTIAQILWRKQHLAKVRMAELALKHEEQITKRYFFRAEKYLREDGEGAGNQPYGKDAERDCHEGDSDEPQGNGSEPIPSPFEEAKQELGKAYALVEMGQAATMDGLIRDLDIQRRLDARIESCMRRLLMVRGAKSMTRRSASDAVPALPPGTRSDSDTDQD